MRESNYKKYFAVIIIAVAISIIGLLIGHIIGALITPAHEPHIIKLKTEHSDII